ncbi:MAG: hypothetical protein O3A00_16700 [Planctomycetota bacterium]|nr:hypothetical protein [Planctomycetota bacterium]
MIPPRVWSQGAVPCDGCESALIDGLPTADSADVAVTLAELKPHSNRVARRVFEILDDAEDSPGLTSRRARLILALVHAGHEDESSFAELHEFLLQADTIEFRTFASQLKPFADRLTPQL